MSSLYYSNHITGSHLIIGSLEFELVSGTNQLNFHFLQSLIEIFIHS